MTSFPNRFRWLSQLLALAAGLVLIAGSPGALALEHVCSMTQQASCPCSHADEDSDDGCCSMQVRDGGVNGAAVPSWPEAPQADPVTLPPGPAPRTAPPRPPMAGELVSAPPRGPPCPGAGHPDVFVRHCTWLI